MEFIGEYLKDHRIKKKLSLDKVSQELNISKSILEKIEDDNFPDYLSSVYLIGHLRSYSKLLELDDGYVVNNYKLQSSYNKYDNLNEISKPLQGIILISIPKSLAVFSTFVVASSFYFMFLKSNNQEPSYAITPDLPENLNYIIEAEEVKISLNKNLDNKNYSLTINNESNIIQENINFEFNSSSAVASLPNKKSINLNKKITLKFINSTWIQLRDNNDNIVISKLMNKDDEYSYDLSKNYNLTAGNAGNIIVFFDDIVMGKVGKFGEVIDSLIIDKNFSN